jgi:hypothetical protein
MIGQTHVTNIALYERLNFDFLRDIAPAVAAFDIGCDSPLPPLPIDRLAQFLAAAKDMVARFVSWGIIELTHSFDKFLGICVAG